MDQYKMTAGINKNDYAQMKGQGGQYSGLYDMSGGYGSADANFMGSNLSIQNPMGFGDMGGATGFENMIPPNDQNMNYYQEYCRLFIANVVLTTQMKELIAEKNELLMRLSELEKRGGDKVSKDNKSPPSVGMDKKARLRRKAAEIERHYICPVVTCQKSYGAEGSLIQHVKLKHPDITQDPEWKLKLQKSEASEGSHT